MMLNEQVRIPTYRVETELSLMESLSDNKPSKRIIKSKKGLKAIKALIDLEQNHNTSWYNYLKSKNKDNMNKTALFYRGNKILFKSLLFFIRASIRPKPTAPVHPVTTAACIVPPVVLLLLFVH